MFFGVDQKNGKDRKECWNNGTSFCKTLEYVAGIINYEFPNSNTYILFEGEEYFLANPVNVRLNSNFNITVMFVEPENHPKLYIYGNSSLNLKSFSTTLTNFDIIDLGETGGYFQRLLLDIGDLGHAEKVSVQISSPRTVNGGYLVRSDVDINYNGTGDVKFNFNLYDQVDFTGIYSWSNNIFGDATFTYCNFESFYMRISSKLVFIGTVFSGSPLDSNNREQFYVDYSGDVYMSGSSFEQIDFSNINSLVTVGGGKLGFKENCYFENNKGKILVYIIFGGEFYGNVSFVSNRISDTVFHLESQSLLNLGDVTLTDNYPGKIFYMDNVKILKVRSAWFANYSDNKFLLSCVTHSPHNTNMQFPQFTFADRFDEDTPFLECTDQCTVNGDTCQEFYNDNKRFPDIKNDTHKESKPIPAWELGAIIGGSVLAGLLIFCFVTCFFLVGGVVTGVVVISIIALIFGGSAGLISVVSFGASICCCCFLKKRNDYETINSAYGDLV